MKMMIKMFNLIWYFSGLYRVTSENVIFNMKSINEYKKLSFTDIILHFEFKIL